METHDHNPAYEESILELSHPDLVVPPCETDLVWSPHNPGALMVLSDNTKGGDVLRKSHIMELPIELLLHIRDQLLDDSDVTPGELRSLRLVCKSFNNILAPVVMTNMILFPSPLFSQTRHDVIQHLHCLVHRKGNRTTYTTLTIRNWHRLDLGVDHLTTGVRQVWQGPKIWRFWAFFYIVPAIFIIPVFLVIYLLDTLVHPRTIPRHIKAVFDTIRARYYVTLLPRKLDLPNVRVVRLSIQACERDWAIYRSTRILLVALPRLTELELGISYKTDLRYAIVCLAHLTSLHKLTLLHARVPAQHITNLSAVIARNQKLSHFVYDWHTDVPLNLFDLFRDVPTDKPLRLHHVSLRSGCVNFKALVPHIQPLSSFEFHSSQGNPWCAALLQAKVFPPTIKVEVLDQELVSFIGRHMGIVSLTIVSGTIPPRVAHAPQGSSLCKALTRHAEALEYLCIHTEILATIFQAVEDEMYFLQCAKSLRKVILINDKNLSLYQNPINSIENERRLFHVIARLDRSLTVVIRTRDEEIYHLCVEFCNHSENPLIHDLAGRMLHES